VGNNNILMDVDGKGIFTLL